MSTEKNKNESEVVTYLLKNVPRDIWKKFKETLPRDNNSLDYHLIEMMKKKIAKREKKRK